MRGGEKIEDKNAGVRCAQTVDSACTLQNSGWIPGQIVIDQNIRTVQINSLSQYICGYKNTYVVLLVFIIRIKVFFDYVPGCCRGTV